MLSLSHRKANTRTRGPGSSITINHCQIRGGEWVFAQWAQEQDQPYTTLTGYRPEQSKEPSGEKWQAFRRSKRPYRSYPRDERGSRWGDRPHTHFLLLLRQCDEPNGLYCDRAQARGGHPTYITTVSRTPDTQQMLWFLRHSHHRAVPCPCESPGTIRVKCDGFGSLSIDSSIYALPPHMCNV